MEESIHDLFTVIIKSESMVLEEKKKCQEAKDEIMDLKMQMTNMSKKISESKERILQMEQGFVCSQTAVSQLTFKEELLCANIQVLKQESLELMSKLNDLDQVKNKVMTSFTETASNFCQQYGIGNWSRKTRVSLAKRQTQEFLRERQELLDDVKILEDETSKLSNFITKSYDIQQCSSSMCRQMEDLTKLIEEEKENLRHLQETEMHLLQAAETDEQFIRVQEELEACDVAGLESHAEALEAELSELAQQLDHKERQQQRLQYRQWLRQRQHQHTSTWEQQSESGKEE